MSKLADKLYQVVRDVLGVDGSMVKEPGFAYNENQFKYAMAMAAHFERHITSRTGKTTLGALQAGTGTGKTIGYLVPMLAYASITGRKAIVSTYTRALQAQVMRDAALVAGHVCTVTGNAPVVRKRLGKRNYLSWSGIHRLEDALVLGSAEHAESIGMLNKMKSWLTERDANNELINSGLIADFAEQEMGGELHSSLSTELLGLRSSDEDKDHEAYFRDVALAKEADVVVVNHATLLIDAVSWGCVLDTNKGEHDILVVDEADQIESAGEMISNGDISLFQAGRVVKASEEILGIKSAGQGIDRLNNLAKDLHTSDVIIPLSKTGRTAEFIDELGSASRYVVGVSAKMKALLSKSELTQIERDVIAEIGELSTMLVSAGNAIEATDAALALSWSPVKAFPSIRIGESEPGRIMGKFWAGITMDNDEGDESALLKSIVFTSATIGPPGKRVPDGFDEFFNSIGVFRQGNQANKPYDICTDLMAMFEPSNFGSMKFVLCDPSLPAPSIKAEDSEDVERSPEWVDYARMMIRKAHESGGRSLVLTVSYSDAELLVEGLQDLAEHLVVHMKGERLSECATRLEALDRGILITPAGWEGLNLPNILSHVVITRLPFMRPDTTSLLLLKLKLSRTLSKAAVEGRAHRKVMIAAKRKLTQGIGRLIRSKTDSGCVWIADPRFPLPDKAKRSLHPVIFRASKSKAIAPMTESIPTRFKYDVFESARVLSTEGDLVSFED